LPQPKIAAMRTDLLDRRFISLSDDVICVIDHADTKCCRLYVLPPPPNCISRLRDAAGRYDTATGKMQELVVKHTQEIASISLNCCGGSSRLCVTCDV
jgi:hypothetical protein